MNKLLHRKSNKRLIYVVESKWWHPIYTPPKGLYIARIYRKVKPSTYIATKVRFCEEQGTKPCVEELEYLLRKYE